MLLIIKNKTKKLSRQCAPCVKFSCFDGHFRCKNVVTWRGIKTVSEHSAEPHKPQCPFKMLDSRVHGPGHSERLKLKLVFVQTTSSVPLKPLEPYLVW